MKTNALRIGLLISLLAFGAPAAAEVYRCGPAGQPVYTDHPCADGERLELRAPNVVEPLDTSAARDYDRRIERGRRARNAADAAWLEQHEERQANEDRIRAGRIAGMAVAGMSPAQVRAAMGEPDKVSGDRWTYRSGEGVTRTVTFRDGTVDDVNERKARKSRKKP